MARRRWIKLRSLGKKRKPNLAYMQEWERAVFLRDIRALAERDFTVVGPVVLDREFPGAYGSRKQVADVLDRLERAGELTIVGREHWGRRKYRTYMLNPARVEAERAA